MDLIHPHSKHDVADAVREAAAEGTRLLVVGGRTHMDRGNRVEVDAELWTTMMDEVVAYEPAEMLAVVEAGMRVGELQAHPRPGRAGVAGRRSPRGDGRGGGRRGGVVLPPAASRSRP